MVQKELPPVYILNYDHFGVILWGIDSIKSVLEEHLSRLEKYPDAAVGWDNEAYAYDFMAQNEPSLLERLKESMSRFPGRLGIGSCTYGQPLSRFILEESNVRQLTFAQKCVEKYFGNKRSVYIMSEHAFHCQMPQLLKKAGFEAAILRTHFMMYGYTPSCNEPIVNRTGPDGTILPAVPMYPQQPESVSDIDSGPGPFGMVTVDGKILTDYNLRDSLQVFRETFGQTIIPLVASRADDPGQREEILEAHGGDSAFKWILAEDVFKHLPAPAVSFQPLPDAYYARMPWVFCGNWIWNQTRKHEVKLLTAERLNAVGVALGGRDLSEYLEQAWKSLLVAQHHDIQIMGLQNVGRNFLSQADQHSQAIISEHLSAICSRIGSEIKSRTVIFNPLAWERVHIVRHENTACSCSIPALGFKAVCDADLVLTETPAADKDQKTLKIRFYNIILHPQGGIRQIQDTAGCGFLRENTTSGYLAGIVDGQLERSQAQRVQIEAMPGAATVIEHGTIGTIPYTSEWTFYQDSPAIHWKGRLTVNQQKIGTLTSNEQDSTSAFCHTDKIALHLHPDLTGRVVGIEDHPFAVVETSGQCLQGNYWTAVADKQGGLAVFNRGLMGTAMQPDGHISIPLAFSMYYVWNTIYMKGDYNYELAILPFRGDWKKQDLHKKAVEYNFPCLVFKSEQLSEPMGEQWSPIQSLQTDAVMSAIFAEGTSIYIRFYEYCGQPTSVTFDWMGRTACFEEVDLLLNQIGRMGSVLPMGPYQIRTVRLVEPEPGNAYPFHHQRQYERKKHGDWHNSEWFKAEQNNSLADIGLADI